MCSVEKTLEHVRTALQRKQAEHALHSCETLLTANRRNVAARHLRGRCMAALGRLDAAIEEFQEALSIQPSYFPALADLGVALTALGQHRRAAPQLAAALARDGRSAELHFALGQCRFASGELRAAAESFAAAIARRHDFADAFNNLGVTLDRLGDTANAIRCFEQTRLIQPELPRAHRNLADVLRRAGQPTGAAQALERALELQPEDPELQCELVETLIDAGELARAVSSGSAALARAPNSARAHAALGMALLAANQCEAAAEHLERALGLDTALGYAALNLGEALLRLKRPEQAVQAFRRSLSNHGLPAEGHLGLGRALIMLGEPAAAKRALLDAAAARPDNVHIAVAAAVELEQLGCIDEAARMLEDAAAQEPNDATALHALGGFLHRRGRLADAAAQYERALAAWPQYTRALLDRGNALEALGRLAEATAAFAAALTQQPNCVEALAGLSSCAFRRCDWSGLESSLKALNALPDGLDALHPFLLLGMDLDAARQRAALERHARRLPLTTSATTPPQRRAHPPLRIAYLSPDFREHPVAHAIAAVIEGHDRRRVQPIGVALAARDRSAIGERMSGAFEVLIDAASLSDRDVVSRLHALEIDIAVDLAGFTSGARTGIFAARCAPVQVNYLGFPATMGAAFVDYIIADDVVIPAGEEPAYAERVLRLPHCYLPHDCTRTIATGTLDREAAGLPAQGVVFCAFNNGYKITRIVFATWMSILREVPGSVLWLRSLDAGALAKLRHDAEELGVRASRLVFAPRIERMGEYLARLQLADLFLDTLPYNAHTTAADALLARVPVLTCRGNSFAGRVGASLLTSAGLPDLICASLEEYRERAVRLATHATELRSLRARLASPATPLVDTRLYTRNLEALFLECKPEAS
jgi:protein O-GlcNAc transferase